MFVGKDPTYLDPAPEYGHVRLYTVSMLRKILAQVGFDVLEVSGTTIPTTPTWLKILDVLIASLKPTLGRMLIMVCPKRPYTPITRSHLSTELTGTY